ncbi:hypothetical protein STSP2_00207 [Anaerohalosphaera lusitana]|uniref:Uncharacterized protein n=1 Tax=Anaerohalosphaera lusitana TaxID=1936003 RepID=A0A1U9NH21_9BACT|nr:hypothetical protein [Anaerohalosphaera lusitana]AQT67067.1 hypothetical protein STSP2_00207 [Anaerohalosphaera lusitana]
MKRLFALIIVLAAAGVSFGVDVDFKLTDNGDGTGTLSWTINKPDTEIVGMALNVDCIEGQIGSVQIDSYFDVFPDAAHSDPTLYDGALSPNQLGSPIAPQAFPGTTTLPNSSFCISVAHLEGETDGTGIILGSGTSVSGEIDINAIRGGIVDQNGDAMTTNLPFQFGTGCGCFPCGHPDYGEWVSVGMPESWCNEYQCEGDSDGLTEGSPFTGYYRVGVNDLNLLVWGWKDTNYVDPATDPWIAADFDHAEEGSPFTGFYRVGVNDLNILIANWKDDTNVTGECLDDRLIILSLQSSAEEIECFPAEHPDYNTWMEVGRPESWCNEYQCEGDADGGVEGCPFGGFYHVGVNDLNLLINGWKQTHYSDPATHPWIAADFDHKVEGSPFTGYYRVGVNDLNILTANWKDDYDLEGDCLEIN